MYKNLLLKPILWASSKMIHHEELSFFCPLNVHIIKFRTYKPGTCVNKSSPKSLVTNYRRLFPTHKIGSKSEFFYIITAIYNKAI